jgi:2-oxoglutarate ferredoxin oxidoreductase subunit alpha
MRVRAVPFHSEVESFIASYDQVFVVELNREGQLRQLLTMDFPKLAARLVPTNFSDGLPLTARWVVDAILENLSDGGQN